jgi:hypothetical protein
MISRRNIRVKVMQELYALQSREDVEEKLNPVEDLQKSLQYSTALFCLLALVYYSSCTLCRKRCQTKSIEEPAILRQTGM